jgi:hypothetical protein
MLKDRIDPDFYRIDNLGNAGDLPILMVRPKSLIKGKKNIFITAGFHGDEIAGPWSLGTFLFRNGFKTYDANVSIIPVVNPSGFSNETRYNQWNEVSNQGFVNSQATPSREGLVLLKNIEELKELGSDGFISLHENDRRKNFYFYMHAKKKPAALISKVSELGRSAFGLQPDGTYEDEREGKYTIENGCVFNKIDDTFEDYMFSLGTPICMVSETPSMDVPLKSRMVVNCSVTDIFLRSIL